MDNIPKFNYGKVQPVAFNDGMSLYEEVAKINESQNELIDKYNELNFDGYAKESDLQSLSNEVTKNESDITSLQDNAILKQDLLQEFQNTPDRAMSAYATGKYIDDSVDVLTKGYISTNNVVQNKGNSETLIMSQKAVTDALTSINNVGSYVGEYTNKIPQTTTLNASIAELTNLPDYTQTATVNFSSSDITSVQFGAFVRCYDSEDTQIDQKPVQLSDLTPPGKIYSVNLTLPPTYARIILIGQSGVIFTLNTSISYQGIIDNTLEQTTGDSETRAMSQKAVTDALASAGAYNRILLTSDNAFIPLDGLYDSYETNTEYILKHNNVYFGVLKTGDYRGALYTVTNNQNLNTGTIVFNANNTFSILNLVQRNFVNTHNTSSNSVYNTVYINKYMPLFINSITASSNTASVTEIEGVQRLTINTTNLESDACILHYSNATFQSVARVIYGYKPKDNTTMTIWVLYNNSIPASTASIIIGGANTPALIQYIYS